MNPFERDESMEPLVEVGVLFRRGVGSIIPTPLAPGTVVGITSIPLYYKGPELRFCIGLAWIPRNVTNFDDGASACVDFVGFSRVLPMPASSSLAGRTIDFLSVDATPNIAVPTPGVQYPLRGGGTRDFAGEVDAWKWFVNISKLERDLGRDPSLTDIYRYGALEAGNGGYAYAVDDDANVFTIA